MPYIPGDTVVFDPVNGWGFAGLDQANSESEMFSYNQVGLICNRGSLKMFGCPVHSSLVIWPFVKSPKSSSAWYGTLF